jgi:hypothetical protein
VKFVLKTEKATEPSREALAAFGFCKAARVAWLPIYRRHVRLGLRLFDRRVLFLNQRLEDSLVAFCSIFRPTIIDGKLTAQSQSTHDFVVTLDVRLLQVIEQAPALRDHLQQSPARMIVFLVDLEMLGEFVDSLA